MRYIGSKALMLDKIDAVVCNYTEGVGSVI